MAEHAEQAFIKNYLNTLVSQPITYPDDYQQPPENTLKKVPILPVELPPPPERKPQSSISVSATINITIKSLKPPKTFILTVQLTDTIANIKTQLAMQPGAPPIDTQRLLLRGKALADGKLLKEYDVKDGDTVNLMVKPGYEWDTTSEHPNPYEIPKPSPSPPPSHSQQPSPALFPETKEQVRQQHSRTPSIILSPSPAQSASHSPLLESQPFDIPLTLDPSTISTPSLSTEPQSTYHATIAKPEFWDRLHSFLKTEFTSEMDAQLAFEDYLRASKGTLSASEVARIRDEVGVVGMAGT